jgi:hypothetical protein
LKRLVGPTRHRGSRHRRFANTLRARLNRSAFARRRFS